MKLSTIKRTVTKDDIGRQALFPTTRRSVDDFETVKYNVHLMTTIRQPRNLKHHDKWWALCELVFQNKEAFQNKNQVSDYLKIKSGHTETIEVDGLIYNIPASINFESTDQQEFSDIWDKAIPHVCELLKCSEDEINNNIVFEGIF